MARLLKPKQSHHALSIRADRHCDAEATLVQGGKRGTYLVIHIEGGGNAFPTHASFSGEKALRALAKAILKEVGDG